MGYYVQRRENSNSNVIYTISDKPLTEEEWEAMYCVSPEPKH